MKKIEVKAKPGRVARVSKDGEFIPEDEYVPVELTPYMHRLIHVHGDVEVKKTPAPAAKAAPKPAPVAKTDDPKKEAN